jgi:FAD/FMN-containing dehydrogenase
MARQNRVSSPESVLASISISRLRSRLKGRVIAPEDAEYDQARTVFYGGFDCRPATIVRAADDEDVVRVITIANEESVELAVRSGGHSPAGHGVTDGGIVLDLADMRGLEIDARARTARAQAGLTSREYSTRSEEAGFATPFGDTGSVGVGGITLGGGVGYLVRKHGLTIDSLLAADVITADGQKHGVDPETHPDLFWAIRGGGGNFGVATRFLFRLHELGPVTGGMLILPATPDSIAGVVDAAEKAPEEVSAIATIMPAPPLPFLPPEWRGRLIIMAMLVHAGPGGDGAAALASFRSIAKPIVDMIKPMRYTEIFPPDQPGFHPLAKARTMFLDGIDSHAAGTIIERIKASDAPMCAVQVRILGGAMARVPAEATAFAHRGRKIMANVAALYSRPEEAAARDAWVAGLTAALHPREGAYVNFLGDEGEARVREAYPGTTWDRLRAIKRRYDPENLFRRNQNIPPAD